MSADPSPVRSLLRRVIGPNADHFSLEISPDQETEFFEVSASGGQVEVIGSTLSALARGSYHYLKHACHFQYWPETIACKEPHSGRPRSTLTPPSPKGEGAVDGVDDGVTVWSDLTGLGPPPEGSQNVAPQSHLLEAEAPGRGTDPTNPTPKGSRTIARWSKTPGTRSQESPWTLEGSRISGLPDFGPLRIDCPNRIRYYLSVCTFGYSTVWWDWPRWEQEIDWMALRGINMPLALIGQELIWQRVFRKLGLEENEIDSFFSGPTYLPWHRLGNLDGYMGPLSQDWMESQAALQHKILDRQRELGMTPVVPGFSGFVPAGFADHYPDVQLRSAEPWAGFPPTAYIDPIDPMFVEVGSLFVAEYQAEFGASHHYLCETFAEQLPQIEAGHELDHLRAIGAATWESLHRADPDCHWVMQGWPFHFGRDFWTPERGKALFEAVPDGRTIILDQVTEAYEIWRDQPVVRDKGWIHCVVHNYGQNTHLHGDLAGFAKRAWDALSSPDRGHMLGMGIVPEGIDQNPLVYELLTDLMWSPVKIDVGVWVCEYVKSRYSSDSPGLLLAWKHLLDSAYGKELDRTPRFSWRYRPGDQPILTNLDLPAIRKAVEDLLTAGDELATNPLFIRDLVDVAKTWLGGVADLTLEEALADPSDHGKQDRFFDTLVDLDRLLATKPEHRLSTWIAAARGAAGTTSEADRFEHNARSLITHWGGPFLFDYAIREWAGLTLDFHAERWKLYFADRNRTYLANWEEAWAGSKTLPKESEPEDPIALIKDLLGRYPEMAILNTVCHDLRLFVADTTIEINFSEARLLSGVAVYPMFGQGFAGRFSISLGHEAIQQATHPICRGARATFEPQPVRQIRIEIEAVQGEATQQFQVLAFEPATP